MGNIHSGISNYVDRFPLGDSAEIVLRKTKNCRGRQVTDAWTAEYSVGRARCELGLTKISRNKHDEELLISIQDHAPEPADDDVDLQMEVSLRDSLLLSECNIHGPSSLERLPEQKTRISDGGVIKSSSLLYGRDSGRKGLIVLLRTKRRDDDKEWPYMITVMHYFVTTGCSSHVDVDVGISLVAKIRSDKGEGFSLQLENPVTHPKHHLLSMFKDVKRTGWRPNPSFDCSASAIQREDIKPVHSLSNGHPFPFSISGEQNVSSLISTSGFTHGNYNGSFIFDNCHIRFDYARK